MSNTTNNKKERIVDLTLEDEINDDLDIEEYDLDNLDVDKIADDYNKKTIKKSKEIKKIEKNKLCSNFWCKAWFTAKYYENESCPSVCPKCSSFDNELSDGVEGSEKTYDGPRHDGLAHEMEMKFSEYNQRGGFWKK